jgi:hypothetical protein
MMSSNTWDTVIGVISAVGLIVGLVLVVLGVL